MRESLVVFAEASAWIVGPVISALVVGKWLDRKYGTEPYLLLSCMAIAFTLTIIMVYRTVRREMRKLTKDNGNKP